MTLTELRYIVAVAREKHFGRAAEACFVSQPTLSVAVKKLEDELDVKIFERGGSEVSVTPLGEQIVRQAIKRVPQMPLMLHENFTVKLLEMLRTGELDCAIMAEPFPDAGLAIAPLYDEPFMAALPRSHPLAKRKSISAEELKKETMLLLGTGHCFRDHVLEVCPEFARFSSDAEGIRKSFEGSALETIKYMVASGMGVTVMPRLSVPKSGIDHVRTLAFEAPVPSRRVVLAWRRSFTRYEAIAALRNAVMACSLDGVTRVN